MLVKSRVGELRVAGVAVPPATVMVIPVGTPLLSSRLVMLLLYDTKTLAVTAVPAVPPVQVITTSPVLSENASA